MATFDGIDISRFQGTITWSSVAGAESFAIIKCGGGDSGIYTDSAFSTNQTNARATGTLKLGYYWFGSLGLNDPTTEANAFISAVGTLQTGEWLALDAESEASAGITLSQTSVAWCKTFLDTLSNHFGFKPHIYMSQSPAQSLDWSTVQGAGYRLWVASYGVGSTNSTLAVGAWGTGGYDLLQYSSTGSVSGISGNVDKDTFFGASLSAWDSLGYNPTVTPSPGTGSTNTGTASASSQPRANSPLNIEVPKAQYDKILYSETVTFSISNSVGQSVPSTITSGLNQYAYPIGIFTIDGGATYSDMGGIPSSQPGYVTATYPAVTITPSVNSSGRVQLIANVYRTVGTGGTIPVTASFCLLATPTPSPVSITSLQQAISYSSAIVQSTYTTYRRIAKDSSISGSGSSDVVLSFPHGAGGVPNLLFWFTNSGALAPQGTIWGASGIIGYPALFMDATNVYYAKSSASGFSYQYRIYKDN